jgi:hypothetical protein
MKNLIMILMLATALSGCKKEGKYDCYYSQDREELMATKDNSGITFTNNDNTTITLIGAFFFSHSAETNTKIAPKKSVKISWSSLGFNSIPTGSVSAYVYYTRERCNYVGSSINGIANPTSDINTIVIY